MCAEGYEGTDCDIKVDACIAAGLDCGIYGECHATEAECVCAEDTGFTGDLCQYGPTCDLTCKNGGIPLDPLECLSEKCVSCNRFGLYEGDLCQTCGLECSNGATKNKDCLTCKCAPFFTGEKCQTPFVSATMSFNIDPSTSDIFDSDESEQAFMNYLAMELTTLVLARDPSRHCVDAEGDGFKARGLCRSDGPLEPSLDRDCHMHIQSHESGYCECDGEEVMPVSCEHPVFTCEEVCFQHYPSVSSDSLWVSEISNRGDSVEATILFHGYANGPESREDLKDLVEERDSNLYHTYIGSFADPDFWNEASPPPSQKVINGAPSLACHNTATLLAMFIGLFAVLWR